LARGNELQDGDAWALEASMSEGRVTVSVHPLHGSHNPPGDATLALHIPTFHIRISSVVISECLMAMATYVSQIL
jgi:hypothetical protein